MNDKEELYSKIIDMILEGYEKTKIAKELNIARSWLYKILDKPEVKAELETRRAHLRKSANDKITSKVGALVDEMISLAMSSTDQRVKYNAIKTLLDRSLGTPIAAKEDHITTVDNTTVSNNVDEQLAKVKVKKYDPLEVVR